MTQAGTDAMTAIQTPALLLDREKMHSNIERLQNRISALGAELRPHLKTAKSLEIARILEVAGADGFTVSTLREAEFFGWHGFRDLVYAVGITPDKIARVAQIRETGCDLAVILDTREQAQAILDMASIGCVVPALIEIDCDGHRGGLKAGDPEIVAIGRMLAEGGALRGVLTHAGESYHARGAAALQACAEQERASIVAAADQLRQAGLECPVVSLGSTPTAHFATDLSGVTEVRAGVYVLFDLVQHRIGVCNLEDIAVSVMTSVIGATQDPPRLFIDAGWMALSSERDVPEANDDFGHGLVCDIDGNIIPGLIVSALNQEHGVVMHRPGGDEVLPMLPIGTRLRILPIHACATASQFSHFVILPRGSQVDIIKWPRISGW